MSRINANDIAMPNMNYKEALLRQQDSSTPNRCGRDLSLSCALTFVVTWQHQVIVMLRTVGVGGQLVPAICGTLQKIGLHSVTVDVVDPNWTCSRRHAFISAAREHYVATHQ